MSTTETVTATRKRLFGKSDRGEREEACGGRLDAFTDDFARRFMGRPKASNPISCQRTDYRWDEILSHDIEVDRPNVTAAVTTVTLKNEHTATAGDLHSHGRKRGSPVTDGRSTTSCDGGRHERLR